MKILAEISEKTLGLNDRAEVMGGNYRLRKSARGIVLNETGEMAVQHLQKYNVHKLPGGGMELGETIEQTLVREIKEEVGCDVKIIKPVGIVIEYRADLLHISYCFVTEMVSKICTTKLEIDEIESEQTTVWMMPEMCLRALLNDAAKKERGDFVLQREIAFLTEYLNILY